VTRDPDKDSRNDPSLRKMRREADLKTEASSIIRRASRTRDGEPTTKQRERLGEIRQELNDLKKGKGRY